jgi:hypothetical protein
MRYNKSFQRNSHGSGIFENYFYSNFFFILNSGKAMAVPEFTRYAVKLPSIDKISNAQPRDH